MYSEELVQFIEEKRMKYPISSLCKMINLYFDKQITTKALRKYYYRHNLDYKKDSRGNYDCRNWNCTHSKPIGSESKPDKNGLVKIKVTEKQWVYKQRYIYEKHYGEIPKGYKVVFLNGDKNDYDPKNLVIARGEDVLLAYAHELTSKDRETTRLGLNVAHLMNKVNSLER